MLAQLEPDVELAAKRLVVFCRGFCNGFSPGFRV